MPLTYAMAGAAVAGAGAAWPVATKSLPVLAVLAHWQAPLPQRPEVWAGVEVCAFMK
jgi:hypothetical protein